MKLLILNSYYHRIKEEQKVIITYNLSKKLILELNAKGYTSKIGIVNDFLYHRSKSIKLTPTDLFFIDGGFYNINTDEYFFLISSPLFDIKSLLIVDTQQLKTLTIGGYIKHFSIAIISFKEELPSITINRQYGMKKISLKEFDKERYEFRLNFPDFPSCPYGHNYKGLGYDKQEKEYVRLAPSILKKQEIKRINYNRY